MKFLNDLCISKKVPKKLASEKNKNINFNDVNGEKNIKNNVQFFPGLGGLTSCGKIQNQTPKKPKIFALTRDQGCPRYTTITSQANLRVH